jgi:hypothetical protein
MKLRIAVKRKMKTRYLPEKVIAVLKPMGKTAS